MHQLLTILFIMFLGSGSLENQSGEKAWSSELNTAKDADYMIEVEKEVIHELNKVRSNPKRYAEEYMEELLEAFDGTLFFPSGAKNPHQNRGRDQAAERVYQDPEKD